MNVIDYRCGLAAAGTAAAVAGTATAKREKIINNQLSIINGGVNFFLGFERAWC
jgi:hypothetical protein